jgi:hypothetical protein
LATRFGQGGIGQAAAAGSGTGQTVFLQHPGRAQCFHNDAAVGFGQPGGELMGSDRWSCDDRA